MIHFQVADIKDNCISSAYDLKVSPKWIGIIDWQEPNHEPGKKQQGTGLVRSSVHDPVWGLSISSVVPFFCCHDLRLLNIQFQSCFGTFFFTFPNRFHLLCLYLCSVKENM